MIEHVESYVLTELDAMYSIVLRTCDACWTIQLNCNLISPQHFPLQLFAQEYTSLSDDGYMLDQDSRCVMFVHHE
jgi:hypothetical protein